MNEPVLYVNGQFVPKSQAVISVYDSGFQHGDGVYEGIRVYKGRVLMVDAHIRRLFESAKAIDIHIGITEEEMKEVVFQTLRLNSHLDDIHIRLMVTRGLKEMTGMNPKLNVSDSSIVVCLESKPPIFSKQGVKLITSTLRRYPPDMLDPKIHSMNQLNQIMAAIEANRQGADEAIMLDTDGFVAETNSTTIFMVKDGVFVTPTTKHILVGITRGLVLDVVRNAGYVAVERDISLSEFYNADEVFLCGTVGEIVPVCDIDGKLIGKEVPGILTRWLSAKYTELTKTWGTPLG